ncbi:MAG: hypothetical protein ACREIS_00800 [Nitrospiraceae bacterium]
MSAFEAIDLDAEAMAQGHPSWVLWRASALGQRARGHLELAALLRDIGADPEPFWTLAVEDAVNAAHEARRGL